MTFQRQYCERLSDQLWAEPINAISNAAFFAAAIWIYGLSQARKAEGGLSAVQNRDRKTASLLALLIALVGLGSLVFHVVGSPETGVLDVAFIGLYLLAYAALVPSLLWRTQSPWIMAALGVMALAACVALGEWGMPLLRTAGLSWAPPGFYVGAWLALALLWLGTRLKAPQASGWMLMALLVFPVSLTARQLDLPLCEAWSLGAYGLHWLWHSLNAVVLGCTARAFLVRR